MEHLDRLLIERACNRLVTAYCHYIDRGDAALVPELFTAGGCCTGAGMQMEGRAELERGFQARQNQPNLTSAHLCQNFLCDIVDDDHANGVTHFTLYRHDGELEGGVAPLGGPTLIGEYRDRFERTSEGWRIADRRIHVTFLRDMP